MNFPFCKKFSLISLLVLFLSQSILNAFESVEETDRFVSNSSWVLVQNGKEAGALKFQSNYTIAKSSPLKLGNKTYYFWEVSAHPTQKGRFMLRVQASKKAGWYSFTWDNKKSAWTSKNWPKHQIKKK